MISYRMIHYINTTQNTHIQYTLVLVVMVTMIVNTSRIPFATKDNVSVIIDTQITTTNIALKVGRGSISQYL